MRCRRRGGRAVVRAVIASLALLALSAATATATASSVGVQEVALQAFRTGRYEEAIDLWQTRLREGVEAGEAARRLVRALGFVGRYDEAVRVGERYLRTAPDGVEVANRLGEALRAIGRLDAAEAAWRRAVEGAAADAVEAELNLAILSYDRGDHRTAMRRFDRFIDIYNRTPDLGARGLTAVGVACTYLGIREPQLFHDAVRAFDEAIAADPGDPEPRVLLGRLFLDKYDGPEAEALFAEVLEVNDRHPDALLGMARRRHFDHSPEALEWVDRALEVNPRHVGARAFRARLLLTEEDYAAAEAEADRALQVNPAALPALSMKAAARWLQHDQEGFRAAVGRALEIDPRHAEIYNSVAELAVQNRLYDDAVRFAERAVELDPASWASWGTLGINQLRIARIEEGRASLERAFEGDPFNVWIKNTLDLLDTFPDYETLPTSRFELVIEGPEAELLSLYMGPLAEEAYDRLARRYGHRPPTPIRVEVYPSHADFSVRTVGLAGLGALGVSFGPVIALDSPSARARGEFNWGATLWHEIAHTFTLGVTDSRIPRWLTEGLSVHEERLARPGWGDDVAPSFLVASLQGRLPPVSQLTDGFVRPRYPEQIAHSYYQASLVCELVEVEHGFEAILEMLDGYRRGLSQEEIFRQVLGMEPGELDAHFEAWLQERFAGPLKALVPVAERRSEPEGGPLVEAAGHDPTVLASRAREAPGDWALQLAAGMVLFGAGRDADAVAFLERARELFPEYAGGDSPYWYLGRIRERGGDLRGAIESLQRLVARNERHWEGHRRLADLLLRVGDHAAAAEILERLVYIHPYDVELHEELATLAEESGRWQVAVRERRAVLALAPADRAAALYRLARAQLGAGDRSSARRSVLQALEIAPGYAEAQRLLLQLHEDGEDP